MTERDDHEQRSAATNTVLRTIVDNLPMGVLVENSDRDILIANDTLCDVLDVPIDSADLIGRDCATAAEELKDLFADPTGFIAGIEECIDRREPVYNEELLLADGRMLERDYVPYTLPDGDANLWLYRDITDRKRQEEALTALHEATNEFIEAPDLETVADHGVETARTVLDRPINGIWLYDESEDELRPVACTKEASDVVATIPSYSRGRGLSWEAFESGEVKVYNDLRGVSGRINPDGPIQSEIILPLGEFGVMNIGSTEAQDFDEIDVSLARILANTIEAALTRANRDNELRTRRHELERQNERLEEFASVVSHDLRNPLNVAQGRLELAREECDSDHLDDAANAVDRSLALIDDLLALAREGEDSSEVEPVDLTNMCDGCWKTVETGNATLVNTISRRIRADPGRLKQLLENLMRNAVEHGGDDVTVTVGELDDGFYVADDGPGIPAEEREQVFEAGYSTAEGGTGFGLNIVREIVEAHDWAITVTDSEQGGARFEITGVEFD